jgi:hypothetical protein
MARAGANPADVINREQVIHRIERLRLDSISCAPRLLAPLGMVALNDAAAPSIWFGVGNCVVKH